MEFRPFNLELNLHCAETPSCTNCKFRVGCPIRKKFYDQDENKRELNCKCQRFSLLMCLEKKMHLKHMSFLETKC